MAISKRLRQSARGQECTLRLAGCNFNTETVILAHLSVAGRSGMGMKAADIESCFSCSNCHDVIDGRSKGVYDGADLLRAHFETIDIWIKAGLIKVL